MLTDDDLGRQLSGAFRGAAHDLTYAGPVPAPRSTITTIGVPLASSAAVVAALAVVWASSPDSEVGTPPGADGPTTAATRPSAPEVVTEKVEVAGFTFSYRHAAGDSRADDLYGDMDVTVPDDATPIEAPEGVKAWVGVDPDSGDHAIYVDAPTRNGGQVFALLSPTWTEDQLVDLFRNGRPRPVPAV